jgi:hypothetical protein
VFSPGWLTHDPKTAKGVGEDYAPFQSGWLRLFARRTFQFFCSSVKFVQKQKRAAKATRFVVNSRS